MKVDHTKLFYNLYNQSRKEISIVQVPPMNFVTIRGSGNPNEFLI